MKETVSTVDIHIAAPREAVFLHIVPIELAGIFTGYGPLPAVLGTRGQTGAWDGAGQERTVLLSDGSTAHEQLTAYEKPQRFAYTVDGFTGPLRFLATAARGEWWFEEAGPGSTRVRWQYRFIPRSRLALPLLHLINRLLWRAYMRSALALAARHFDAGMH